MVRVNSAPSNADSNTLQSVCYSTILKECEKCKRDLFIILAHLFYVTSLLYWHASVRWGPKLYECFHFTRLDHCNWSWYQYSPKSNYQSKSCALWGTSKVDSSQLFPISHSTSDGCDLSEYRIFSSLSLGCRCDIQCQLLQMGFQLAKIVPQKKVTWYLIKLD